MDAPHSPAVAEAVKKCMRAMMVANPQLAAVSYISLEMTAKQAHMLAATAENLRILADSFTELAQVRLLEINSRAAND